MLNQLLSQQGPLSILSRFLVRILSAYIAIAGALLSSQHIFAFSHRSRPTKHEQISSRCASSQKEKGAAAIICTAVRTVRVQTIRLETVSREWNEGLLFHCRIIGDEQICRTGRICLPFGACLGGLCWTAPRVHASVVGFLSSPERTQSVPYLQIYRVFSMAMSFV